LSSEKQSFFLKFANAFNSRNLNQQFRFQQNANNYRNSNSRFDNRDIAINKARVYVIDYNENYENNKEIEKIFREYNSFQNYYVFKKLNYYKFYNESKNNNDIFEFFIISEILFIFDYQYCKKSFSFNNKLHLYVRKIYQQKSKIRTNVLLIEAKLKKFFTKLKKFFANVFTIFKTTRESNIFIISFTVDFYKNVDIEYNFRS